MKHLWLFPIIIILDQVTKVVVERTMILYQSISVLGGFFQLTYIHNAGAAFGLNIGSPLVHTLFSLVALGVLGWLWRTAPVDALLLRYALVVVLGGAVGNIIDRVRLGKVIDFFDFGFGDLRWPIFNVADSAVTVGVFLLIIAYGRLKEDTPDDQASHT